MAFMTPEYEHGFFATFEENYDFVCVPLEYVKDVVPECAIDDISGELKEEWKEDCDYQVDEGWFCRLSASGYLDCTEWCGPFDSLEEAREHVVEFWEVDPETGDELEEEI